MLSTSSWLLRKSPHATVPGLWLAEGCLREVLRRGVRGVPNSKVWLDSDWLRDITCSWHVAPKLGTLPSLSQSEALNLLLAMRGAEKQICHNSTSEFIIQICWKCHAFFINPAPALETGCLQQLLAAYNRFILQYFLSLWQVCGCPVRYSALLASFDKICWYILRNIFGLCNRFSGMCLATAFSRWNASSSDSRDLNGCFLFDALNVFFNLCLLPES